MFERLALPDRAARKFQYCYPASVCWLLVQPLYVRRDLVPCAEFFNLVRGVGVFRKFITAGIY